MEKPIVAISRNNDRKVAVNQALEASHLMELLPIRGATVFIKPNLVGPSRSGGGRVTDWRVVQALVDVLNDNGAGSISVGEGPVEGNWKSVMAEAGYYNLSGAKLIDTDMVEEDCIPFEAHPSLSGHGILLPKPYAEADIVISVPVLKTHFTTGVSLGMKNLGIGMPPLRVYGDGEGVGNTKSKLHSMGLNKVIADVCAMRMPDVTLIDGTVGGEGKGPTEPTPVPLEVVVAGGNVVAVDAVGTRLMGIDPREIAHLVYAADALGLGPIGVEEIQVVGCGLDEAAVPFRHPPNKGYPLKRTMVIGIAGNTKWDRLPTPKGPGRVSANHEGGYLKVICEVPGTPTGLVLMNSCGMPFDIGAGETRHSRGDKDKVMASSPDGTVTQLHSMETASGSRAKWFDVPKGPGLAEIWTGIEFTCPLVELGITDNTAVQEVWLDFGVLYGPGDTCNTLWSGAPYLGVHTDPTTAGRILLVPW